jgi:hypothetical protein
MTAEQQRLRHEVADRLCSLGVVDHPGELADDEWLEWLELEHGQPAMRVGEVTFLIEAESDRLIAVGATGTGHAGVAWTDDQAVVVQVDTAPAGDRVQAQLN